MSKESAVIYVRVSTKAQDEKYSPDVQLNICRAYAEAQGLTVVEEFREAASGWKAGRRPKYFGMIDFIQTEKVHHLIYAFTDRIARNLDDWIPLRKTDVTLHNAVTKVSFTPSRREDYEKLADFEHGLVDARKSSDSTGKKVRDSQAEKVGRGEYPGSSPLGYLLEPIMVDGKPLVIKKELKRRTIIDPVRGPLLRRMFELYASGEYSLRDLVEKMKNLGLRSKADRVLILEEVRRYLRTPFYYGTFKWGGKFYPNKGTYEPIVNKGLFDAVQEVLDGRRVMVKRGKEFKYKGLLTCDFCGCAIVGDEQRRGKGGTPIVYYRCTGGKRTEWYQEHYHRPKCPLYYGPYHTEKDIDQFFETAIEALYVDPNTYEWVQNELEEDYKNLKALNRDEARNLRMERSKFESQEAAIIERLGGGPNPAIIAAYERHLEHIEQRKLEIESRLEELDKGEPSVSLGEIKEALELSKALKDKYLAASPEKRTKLNALLFRTVRITKEGYIPEHDENDPYITIAPFYFVWNEPFKSLWEIGFIQGMGEAKAGSEEQEKASERVKTKKWRGRRDSNSRPPA
jgi:site-specific DNA recombinase